MNLIVYSLILCQLSIGVDLKELSDHRGKSSKPASEKLVKMNPRNLKPEAGKPPRLEENGDFKDKENIDLKSYLDTSNSPDTTIMNRKEETTTESKHKKLSECRVDEDCIDNSGRLICKLDGTCSVRGRGKGGIEEECEHISDCLASLTCVKGKCDQMGRKGDLCNDHSHCRSDMYCSGMEKNKGKCNKRRTVGQTCKEHYHCLNSICLNERYAVQGQGRLIISEKKFCAVVEQALGKECNPQSQLCLSGFICTKVAKPKKSKNRLSRWHESMYKEADGDYAIEVNTYPLSDGRNMTDEMYGPLPDDNPDIAVGREVKKGKSEKSVPTVFTYVCKPPPSIGSREHCGGTMSCSCGEFCDTNIHICRPATCASNVDCLNYPGFNHRFSCHNSVCMPPQDIYSQAFALKFDKEGAQSQNVTTTSTTTIAPG